MSKSYKKHYIVKQEKVDKRVYNKRLRGKNLDFSPRGGQYKKLVKDFGNWKYQWTKEEAAEQFNRGEVMILTTLEEWLQYWERCVHRK